MSKKNSGLNIEMKKNLRSLLYYDYEYEYIGILIYGTLLYLPNTK